MCAGFVEIVQFIINSAGNGDFVKRMLATTDVEGDTVSLSKRQLPRLISHSFVVNHQSYLLFTFRASSLSIMQPEENTWML